MDLTQNNHCGLSVIPAYGADTTNAGASEIRSPVATLQRCNVATWRDPRVARLCRALHVAGKRRGLSHDDLHQLAGVATLKALTFDQASALLDRLNDSSPERRYRRHVGRTDGVGRSDGVGRVSNPSRSSGFPTRTRPRLAPGIIRPVTPRQRMKLFALCRDLGLDAAQRAAELARLNIHDLDRPDYSSRTANLAINALERRYVAQCRARMCGAPREVR